MNLKELKDLMKENRVNNQFFQIGLSWAAMADGHAVCAENGEYLFFYVERGVRSHIEKFKTESEVCERALNHLKKDKWSSSHNIGFFKQESEALELMKILDKFSIEYHSDKIPFGGIDDPRYRVFVFGKDIDKVNKLKLKKIL